MNNQNATFNNMFSPSAIPETKDSSPNNVNTTLTNQQPAQIPNQLNFSMPSASEFQNNNNNTAGAGIFSFVNPSVVGGTIDNSNSNLNNPSNNPLNNDINQNLNTTSVDNNINNQNITQNNPQPSTLSFDLNNNNISTPLQNQSLISTGVSSNDANINNNLLNNQVQSQINNNLLNNQNNTPMNNNLSSTNISNDLVSSELPNNGVVPVENNQDSIPSKSEITPVKSYLLNMILFCIPLIGFIMLIVKALSKEESNIRNLARAYLILSLIVGFISTVLMFVALEPILALITG